MDAPRRAFMKRRMRENLANRRRMPPGSEEDKAMFGIGGTELLVILVVALIVLGPKSVPQIARTLGKAMGEFRRVSTEFQRTLNTEIELEEHEKRKKEAERELYGNTAPEKAPAAAPAAENGKGEKQDRPNAGQSGAGSSGTAGDRADHDQPAPQEPARQQSDQEKVRA